MQKTNEMLLSELNEIRRNQKTLLDFNSAAEWIAYSQDIARKKADIMNQLEALNS